MATPEGQDGLREAGPCNRCSKVGATLRCSRCKGVQYCNIECQRDDWKHGGHKAVCKVASSSGGGEGPEDRDGDGATATDGDPPVDEGGAAAAVAQEQEQEDPPPLCPSCSTLACNASWRGKYPGLCMYCGQLLCGSCAAVITIDGNCGTCPTCAKPNAVITSTIASGTSGDVTGPVALSTAAMHSLLESLLAATNEVDGDGGGGGGGGGGDGGSDDGAAGAPTTVPPPGRHTAFAHTYLGHMYKTGTGVKHSNSEAVHCYQRGCATLPNGTQLPLAPSPSSSSAYSSHRSAGTPDAQVQLAQCHLNGAGTLNSEPNFAEAVRLLQLASGSNDPVAMANLGGMHARGLGIDQDKVEAVELYKRAAQSGHPPSQFNFGMMQMKGQGMRQDAKEAVKCTCI